jgi:predicted CoA-binding protein
VKEVVAVLGASENPERYSNKAFHLLREYGHQAVPVNPRLQALEGEKVYENLLQIPFSIDTITMYLSSEKSSLLEKEILEKKPKRVIFNPGSENPDLQKKLKNHGIDVEEACTLVLLRTNQFENS